MSTIRIHRTLDSDTLHLPELKPLIGREVDITVTESPIADAKDWSALEDIAGKDLIDPEIVMRYREFDKLHNKPPDL
jgi:hypothetical protein